MAPEMILACPPRPLSPRSSRSSWPYLDNICALCSTSSRSCLCSTRNTHLHKHFSASCVYACMRVCYLAALGACRCYRADNNGWRPSYVLLAMAIKTSCSCWSTKEPIFTIRIATARPCLWRSKMVHTHTQRGEEGRPFRACLLQR
jgi:hypothetical protein